MNSITGKLIELYKNKNYGRIREIANKISKYVTIDEEKDAKCFSKLIVLYHPDKGELHRTKIQKYYAKNDIESLTKFIHIFQLENIENTTVVTIDSSIDYQPEYAWENNDKEGYYFYDENDINSEEETESEDFEKSFYNEHRFSRD